MENNIIRNDAREGTPSINDFIGKAKERALFELEFIFDSCKDLDVSDLTNLELINRAQESLNLNKHAIVTLSRME